MLATSQGSSESNSSAVFTSEDCTKALCSMHTTFRLSYAAIRSGIALMDDALGCAILELLEIRIDVLLSKIDDVALCENNICVSAESKNDIGPNDCYHGAALLPKELFFSF